MPLARLWWFGTQIETVDPVDILKLLTSQDHCQTCEWVSRGRKSLDEREERKIVLIVNEKNEGVDCP